MFVLLIITVIVLVTNFSLWNTRCSFIAWEGPSRTWAWGDRWMGYWFMEVETTRRGYLNIVQYKY